MNSQKQKEVTGLAEARNEKVLCGLVMPISALDGCTSEHWSEVKAIIIEALEEVGEYKFSVKLVSEADESGVIQKQIVQNVYSSDIIISDVSGKNPNVMFELGLRLAFDKPAIIVKDDKTDYMFDTGIIEHVPYPRDLHFHRMVEFKKQLSSKVVATYRAAKTDPAHSTFLKNFGKFHVASLNESTVSADKFLIESMGELQAEMVRLRQMVSRDLGRGRTIGPEKDRDRGVARFAVELENYVKQNPGIDITTLADNRVFIREIEDKVEAPEYFESPADFRKVCEALLSKMAINDAPIKDKV